jgi:predicted dehydrogenase
MAERGALRVGIVGYGEAGAFHARHLVAAGADVVGAVTTRELDSERRRFDSLTEMLPHVDAVTIAVPNHLHARLCIEVLEAGKPVFVEKPLLQTTRELEALEPVVRSTPLPMHVGFRLHWNPTLRALKERLRGVRRIRCNYRIGIDRLAEGKPWTHQEKLSGGAFFTLGVHAHDLVRWLAGAHGEPLSDLLAHAEHYEDGNDFPLVVSMSGRLPSGIELVSSVDLRGDAPFRLELEVDAESGTYPDPSLPGPTPEGKGSADAEYRGLMAAFVRATTSKEKQTEAIEEILQTHRDLLSARSQSEP